MSALISSRPHAVVAAAVVCTAIVVASLKGCAELVPACGLLTAFQLDAAASALAALAGIFLGRAVVGKAEGIAPPGLPPLLHWNPDIPRRGMGDLLRSVNHVALIVSDVGRALAFYTEIIGFQQIQRPNFDRHGAWLTMGNTELHLIKGVPNAPSGRDLIVSHIALETLFPGMVLEKLRELQVPFRQNISVPDPKKARDNLVECFESAEGKITQYFIRDPDGYYWELCNCDVLTRFCLFKEEVADGPRAPMYLQLMNKFLMQYNESVVAAPAAFGCPQLFKVVVVVTRLVRRARQNLQMSMPERLVRGLGNVEGAGEADPTILANFLSRQKTYCDLTQGFTEQQLIDALRTAGNRAPAAMLVLAKQRQKMVVYHPPQYFLGEGGKVKQQVFNLARRFSLRKHLLGTDQMYASQPFMDHRSTSGTPCELDD